MFEWYDDKNLTILFSSIPHVCIRYILPTHTEDEKKSIKIYPFICKTELGVVLYDKKKDKSYDFIIPKGYCFDGASVPRFFWRLIGSNTDNKFLVAALVHDYMCENHAVVENDRAFSTKVFDSLLKVSEVYSFKRFLMKNSVDIFQKLFCNWEV